MKQKLQTWFALTERGAAEVMRASYTSFCVYVLMILSPTLVLGFISDLLNASPRNPFIYIAAIVLIALLLYGALRREYRLTYDTTYAESAALRIRIAEKLKALPMAYLSKHNLAELSQLVMMDVNNIEMMVSHALPKFIAFSAFLMLITILMVTGQPLMGLAALLPLWVAWGCLFASKSAQQAGIKRYYKTLLKNSESFQNAFELHQEIKSYNLIHSTKTEITRALYESERIHLRAEFFMAGVANLIRILPFLSPVCVILVATPLLIAGKLSLLYFLGYLIAASTFAAQFASIQEFVLMLFFFKDSYARIRNLRDESVQTGKTTAFENFDVTLEHVDFAYGDHAVLHDVSLTAPQGKITAIVGPSGCGKTTLLRLISRLYDADSGTIRIGDHDISGIHLEALYPNLSIVFQNVELFNDTIMENIRMGRIEATDTEVLEAARLANVDELAERLPNGYHTVIGENGSRLSGGERQRISIARAFLKNAPIILLDEISASLDIENERAIQNSLQTLIANKTVIVISHRLRSIEGADQIVVMNNGHIEAAGTHDALLKGSPTYRAMLDKAQKTAQFSYS